MSLRISFLFLAMVFAVSCTRTSSQSPAVVPLPSVSGKEALERLKDGNARYVSGETRVHGMLAEDFPPHLAGQNPYAIVIGCADSRVPVERVFDAGPGEIFVLRVAGNVASEEILGSAEYSLLALETPLLVVLGHSGCGAVKGALSVDRDNPAFPSSLHNLLVEIADGIDHERAESSSMPDAVAANVEHQLSEILETPAFADAVDAGTLQLVGGVYDIGTGHVTFKE